MVSSLLKCPVLFFDTNPAGRVLNRFSKDIGIMDEQLPIQLYGTSSFVVRTALGFVIPAVASYWVIIAIVPLLLVAVYYGQRYIVISREVARIQALNYSHVLSQFSNTKQGLVSIRAYGTQQQFVKELHRLVQSILFCAKHILIYNYAINFLSFLGMRAHFKFHN